MVHDLSDRSRVVFDDERVVVNAGVVLAATLGRRLGLEQLVDAAVRLGGRPGASRPGRKVLSLVHAMLLGADCIDDCDVLRSGRTEAVLGHRAMAPSTLGTFLRSFSFGHVRQLDRVLGPPRTLSPLSYSDGEQYSAMARALTATASRTSPRPATPSRRAF
jgi:hypothetical protein